MSTQEVETYLAKVSAADKAVLQQLRSDIHALVPDATECITYGMPGFKYKGKYLVAYNSFVDHYSVFPGAHSIDACKEQLANFKTSKGTVQFTVDNPLPDSLLRDLVMIRKADIDS